MALEAMVKYGLQRIAKALREYAQAQGWSQDDYRVFVRLNLEWNSILVAIAAKAFVFPDGDVTDAWLSVKKSLAKRLKDEPELLEIISLSLHPLDQFQRSFSHAIGTKFIEIDDLLTSGVSFVPATPAFATRGEE